VSVPEPGRVLRRALIGWGLGHLLLGRRSIGLALLAAEVVAALLVAWLAIGLADSSAYLIPFLAGIGFLVAWAWQAIAAYRTARAGLPAVPPTPERSPAASIGWLALPLLAWGTGFWLVGAHAATPAATLDRFVSDWTAGRLVTDEWPAAVIATASDAASGLGSGPDRFNDLRFRIVDEGGGRASAVADAVHHERRASSFLGVFAGSELVPVADARILRLELVARPVSLWGGGDIGAVRWELVDATTE